MKKSLLALAVIVCASVTFTGCAAFYQAPVVPPTGFIYSDFKAPMDVDAEGEAMGSRSGSAETMSILGLVAMGDASYRTAAANGNITTIHGADYEFFNILGIYSTFTTVVHGE